MSEPRHVSLWEFGLEQLAAHHPNANKPYEPYCGVAALFNGDLHSGMPEYAPRHEWMILSPFVIQLAPIE